MAQLKCDKMTIGYSDRVVAENISFAVNKGDYLCIIGENGAGKSTLIKTILKLIPPLSGKILCDDGLDFSAIGYLPQQTVVQRDFPASVKEIVMSGFAGRIHRPFFGAAEKREATQNMKKLGIENLASRCYRELSGGQQQRVLLARALCATKQMLLLDEPVSGLDPMAASEMYELIARLNKDEKISVIMVSHDIESAFKYATHILHMSETNAFYGTKGEFLASDECEFCSSAGGDKND